MNNDVCGPGHALFTYIVLETLGCWHNLDYWHSDEQWQLNICKQNQTGYQLTGFFFFVYTATPAMEWEATC